MLNAMAEKRNLRRLDLLALFLCAGVFTYLFIANSRGFGFVDEGFYYSLTMRLAQGDKFILDEWHPGQFSALFEYLPYRLFTAVTGGNDGVILFMRYVWLTADLALFLAYYKKIRRFGAVGLFSALLFCAYMFAGICALNYYTICLHAMMTIALLLFLPEDVPPRPVLVFSGVALSCAVLSQPAFVFIYVFYTVLTAARLIGKKKESGLLRNYDFILNGRGWRWMTAGACLCAAACLIFLFSANGISATLKALPDLLGDSEYDMHIYGNYTNPDKIVKTADLLGAPFMIAACACPALAALCRRFFPAKTAKACVLILTCAVILASCGKAGAALIGDPRLIVSFLRSANLYLLVFTPVCYILCEKRNRRIFAFWWIALFTCVVMDYFSEITVDYGCSLAYFPAFYFCAELLKELLRKDDGGVSAPAAFSARAAALLCAILPLWLVLSVGVSFSYKPVEKAYNKTPDRSVSEKLTDGPYKGVRTTKTYAEIYSSVIADLDKVREKCSGPVYVAHNLPYYYLELQSAVGVYSTWYVDKDSEDRLLYYWQTHPHKIPEYVFVPLYEYYTFRSLDQYYGYSWTKKKLAFFSEHFHCETERTATGVVLRITGMRG